MSTVQQWLEVATTADIAATYTNTLRVEYEGAAVCLYLLEDGSVHASQDLCTHGNASLSEGYIENGAIECPLHQGTFDILTGEALTAPCKLPLRVYHVKVEEDRIYLGGVRA
ncbi:MAG: non-heme iron oxygenase ferredoxin subunit [Paenalcaligenes sp.]